MLYAETRPLRGYPDLLNYDIMPTPGVMLLKDGALLAAWTYTSPDLDAVTPEELSALSAHVNAALCQLGDGWMLHCDLFRTPAVSYPETGAFPDATTWLIDEERRMHHQAEGAHYEGHTILALTYKPPQAATHALSSVFIEEADDNTPNLTTTLRFFEQAIAQVGDLLSARLTLSRLTGPDLLTYLHRCTTGLMHHVEIPRATADMDIVLGSEDVVAGFTPQVGAMHVRTVSTTGFPIQSSPSMLAFLQTLPCFYRWNTRFIFLDPQTARKEITRQRVMWSTKVNSLIGSFTEAWTNKPPRYSNEDARGMADDANTAIAEADSGLVRFGYMTMTIVLYHEEKTIVDQLATSTVTALQNHGFPARIERINALEAFLGSLPGHGYQNVRKPLVNTLNLADMLPITGIWAGLDRNSCPKFPMNSPALIHAATTGETPFRLNLHVSDVGHTLMIGPTGAGKTTALNLIMAQFFRYPQAQVFCFDRDYGTMLLTKACKGQHYTVGAEDTLSFCPLARIDEEGEHVWAVEWIESLLILQGLNLTPKQRNEVARALTLLASCELRTLTDFVTTIQDVAIREALQPYTIAGALGWLLDAKADGLRESCFQTFDITTLMHAGEKQLVPVLLYLFHQIERRLSGRPTLICIDEGWMTLLNDVFADQVERWLRTLRKKNASVIFVTQSVADLAEHPKKALILESCPTKIFLANPEAQTANIKGLYAAMGLNDRETEILAAAIPKRHYYYVSPLGRRQFDLALGPIALSFIGAEGDEERRAWQALATVSQNWPASWLKRRGLKNAAHQWKEREQQLCLESDDESSQASALSFVSIPPVMHSGELAI